MQSTKPSSSSSGAGAGTVATTPSVYTTIPISGSDVISRSFQNLSNFLSSRRPWPEFIASGIFNFPDSLSSAAARLRQNSSYFSINYGILITICTASSLIGSPIALIVYAMIFTLWMVLYFFREDPMVVWGRHVSDLILIGCLILVTAISVLFTGKVKTLLIGVFVGIVASAIHGVLRNPEGLYLDEHDAAWNGLIGSPESSTNIRPLLRNQLN
ncbi:PRA1 family protein G2 [Impatiens glandulifera]|uniref:PRA1 family protein G2 n=1 Tax=Impatiens glandulifera TaxID=253017 RepID=UPI001FB08ABE|nr:PRA1 family protein G2 [Impatiens glandulifera]